MSYGFQLLNSDGLVLANDTDFNYALVAEGTANVSGSYPYLTVSYSNSTTELPLVFIRNNGVNYISLNILQPTFVGFNIFKGTREANGDRLVATTDTVFQYKIFLPMKALSTTIPSGDEYGIHIFDANGDKTFDSTKQYPLIAGSAAVSVYLSNTDTATTLSPSISSNPWILISSLPVSAIARISSSSNPPSGGYWDAQKCLRVINNELQISTGYVASNPFLPTVPYPNTTVSKLFFLMNDTSGVPSPLSATISNSPGSGLSNVCNYNPASTGSCSTIEVYTVNVSGGNNSALAYSWSIGSPANGFYINSTNGFSAINIRNDNAGSGSAYTATLTCQVTQVTPSGNVSIYPSIALSHTHTASANPLAATVSRSAQTLACSASTACSTQETFTVTHTAGSGNGNPITYTWSLPSNAGSFSLSATSGTSTTVSLTQTGATTGTTYGATVRCVVSQSGSTSVTIDNAVSHIHTTTSSAAPVATLGFNGQSYADTTNGQGIPTTVNLYMYGNGSWSVIGTGAGTIATGLWYSPTNGTIGSSYWITVVRNSTDANGNNNTATVSLTTPTVLTNGRQTLVTSNAPLSNTSCTANYTVKVFPNNSGTPGTEVCTGTVTLTAYSYYYDAGGGGGAG